MQIVRSLAREDAAQVGWSIRALLVAAKGRGDVTERRLAGIGASVGRSGDLYAALAQVIDNPAACDMLVVECDGLGDGCGGLAEARRIVKLLGETMVRVPVILVSGECQTQVFALERHEPSVLRAPLSAVSMRVAFEHVLRDRLVPQYA